MFFWTHWRVRDFTIKCGKSESFCFGQSVYFGIEPCLSFYWHFDTSLTGRYSNRIVSKLRLTLSSDDLLPPQPPDRPAKNLFSVSPKTPSSSAKDDQIPVSKRTFLPVFCSKQIEKKKKTKRTSRISSRETVFRLWEVTEDAERIILERKIRVLFGLKGPYSKTRMHKRMFWQRGKQIRKEATNILGRERIDKHSLFRY